MILKNNYSMICQERVKIAASYVWLRWRLHTGTWIQTSTQPTNISFYSYFSLKPRKINANSYLQFFIDVGPTLTSSIQIQK